MKCNKAKNKTINLKGKNNNICLLDNTVTIEILPITLKINKIIIYYNTIQYM